MQLEVRTRPGRQRLQIDETTGSSALRALLRRGAEDLRALRPQTEQRGDETAGVSRDSPKGDAPSQTDGALVQPGVAEGGRRDEHVERVLDKLQTDGAALPEGDEPRSQCKRRTRARP